jgi:F0F1-type ATP synthase membrane subunit c/vacuolar-type H+-ATPase subunit K
VGASRTRKDDSNKIMVQAILAIAFAEAIVFYALFLL